MDRSFLIPAMIVRLGKFVSFKNQNGIAEGVQYSDKALEGGYVLMQEVGGEEFVCKIRSNVEDIDADFINGFLKQKAEMNIDKSFKLKIKDALESDDTFIEELEKILEEKDLPRKEEKAFEKEYIENKIEEIAYSEKLIKPGSLVRLPLSSSKEGTIQIEGKTYPIYESLCLIKKEDGEVSESGIYYISQNRHGIPLRLRSTMKDMDVYYWETNNDVITKEEFITLVNHGIRTIQTNKNFYLYFRAFNTEYEGMVGEMLDTFNKEENIDIKAEKYTEALKELIKNANEKEDFHKKVVISLPTKIQKDYIAQMDNSLISKQPMAMTNLLFKNDLDKKSKSAYVKEQMNAFLNDKSNLVNLYGLYSIISTYDALESDTYGFLKNNLKPSSITLGLEDYCNLVNNIKNAEAQEAPVRYKEYGDSYLDTALNASGNLDI